MSSFLKQVHMKMSLHAESCNVPSQDAEGVFSAFKN